MRAFFNLVRLHTAGWEALIFVIAPLMMGESFGTWFVAALWGLGILANSFIFTLNDLADLPRDRLDPSKRLSPLVSGALTTSFATGVACALPILMWVVIVLADWPRPAEIAYALLLLLGTYLCIYQKTAAGVHPLILDGLFGVSMAGPIPVTVLALRHSVPGFIWALAAAFLALCIGLNVVGGNLKDLRSDRRTGFRTTAIAFGVHHDEAGNLIFPTAYRATLFGIWIAFSGSILLAGALSWSRHPAIVEGALATIIVVLCGGVGLRLLQLVEGRRQPASRGREPFFALGMIAVLVVAAAYARPAQMAIAVLATAIWELTFRGYWTRVRHRDLTDSTAASDVDGR